jgi:dolichol-phosphate mannosyltransferase
MYRDLRCVLVVPVLNEEGYIGTVVDRVPRDVVDEVLVVDDGSTDGSASLARSRGAQVLSLGRTVGVGAALREGFQWARARGFDVIAVCAGNNKDAPEELPRLLQAIADGADFVQGSRFLGAGTGRTMPLYRRIATRIHPIVFSLTTGKRVTESTNGFRAFRRTLLDDPRIDLSQSWLDEYELEVYLYWKAVRLGYRTAEVPVTKRYPERAVAAQHGYTKMPPLTGWWSILRPMVLLAFGVKQ